MASEGLTASPGRQEILSNPASPLGPSRELAMAVDNHGRLRGRLPPIWVLFV